MWWDKKKTAVPALITKKRNGLMHSRDLADKLESYLIYEGKPCNFAISGQGDKEHLIKHVLGYCFKRLPVIILHNNNHRMIAKVAQVWQEDFESLEYADGGPLWCCDNGAFEPLLGMDEMDIVHTLINIAQVMGYKCTAAFEKVVKAHLSILRHAGCEYSLTGLSYLCSFEDLEEFQSNILALQCSPSEKNQILANIGIANEKDREQFDQFRSIISRLAYDAGKSGWSTDGEVGCMSISSAIQNNAVLTINVSSSKSPYLLAYLGQEMKLHLDESVLLLIDEVNLSGSGIPEILKDASWEFRFGLLGTNVMNMIDKEKTVAQEFCEKLELIVLTKHRTAPTAGAYSELFGTVEVDKQTTTMSRGKEFWAFLPDHEGESVSFVKDDRPRVRVEQIMNLLDNQVILFDTDTNGVLLL